MTLHDPYEYAATVFTFSAVATVVSVLGFVIVERWSWIPTPVKSSVKSLEGTAGKILGVIIFFSFVASFILAIATEF